MKMMSSPRSRRELLLMGTAAGAAVLMDSPLSAQAEKAGSAGSLPAIDVKSHGAAGDAKTDDTAAFQRALDAASAQGGGVVYAPSGRYLFKGHTVQVSSVLAVIHDLCSGLFDRGQGLPLVRCPRL